jgi:hypothetical protein
MFLQSRASAMPLKRRTSSTTTDNEATTQSVRPRHSARPVARTGGWVMVIGPAVLRSEIEAALCHWQTQTS